MEKGEARKRARENGRYLASASYDKVLRVHNGRQNFRTIWSHQHSSPFTALVWRSNDVLVAGSLQGELMQFYPTKMFGSKTSNVIYKFSSPIPSIEANSVGNQLLVCSSRTVNVLTEAEDHSWSLQRRIDSMSSIGEPANFEEPPVIATGAYYLQDESQCAVSYLWHGLWKVDLETGESEWNWGPDQQIGTSTISPDCRSLATLTSALVLTGLT
ncbi:hypothetical protein BDP27DRAFT_1366061 [Rhodocollybia butyracea]|uniref:Uncharacterized protein n=1 Tax=Rhodocollybia butyracea TaxID=206335 RepID=A0A9P5U4Q0_9AGAR|nr:hypothetical protein BDP27DRAFT_1366061 [Rhodocollybia butyracea]